MKMGKLETKCVGRVDSGMFYKITQKKHGIPESNEQNKYCNKIPYTVYLRKLCRHFSFTRYFLSDLKEIIWINSRESRVAIY